MSQVAEAGGVAIGTGEETQVVLPDHFLIREVEDVYREMCASLDDSEVTIDCTALEAVDTASVQLLYALAKKTAELGVEINWRGEVGPIKEAAELLGLSEELGL